MKLWFVMALASCWLGGWVAAFAQNPTVGLRQLVVGTAGEAAQIRASVLAGAPFELLARERSIDGSRAEGGYLGRVVVADLRAELQDALEDLEPGQISPVVQIPNGYALLQLVSAEEEDWMARDSAGIDAYREGRPDEAVRDFAAAILLAEAFGPEDYRLAQSLNNLAEVHRLEGAYAEAEPLYRRSLPIWEGLFGPDHPQVAQVLNSLGLVLHAQERYAEAASLYERSLAIREEVLGPDHPDVATSLNNLGEVRRLEGEFVQAAALYRRSLAILEGAFGPDHIAVQTSRNNLAVLVEGMLEEVLEQVSTLLTFSDFRDERFDRALTAYNALIAEAPLELGSYLDLADVFISAGLEPLAQELLSLAAESFPDSRELRYHLAERYVNSGDVAKGLEVFREASRLDAPPDMDPGLDRQRRGFIYRRIGDLESNLNDYAAAEAAYEEALEIDPGSVDSRLALGEMYYQINRFEEALEQYAEGAELDPGSYSAYLGLAEINLAMNRYEDAARAADRAVAIEPGERRPRFLRGTARVRSGETDAGRADLEEFGRLEEAAQAAEHQDREVAAISRDAMTMLIQGESDQAVAALQRGIGSYPDDARLYLNLGLTYSKLEQHREAIDAFERILDLGAGDAFLVHKNLASEYGALGDLEASDRHHLMYLQLRDSELGAGLPE